MGPESVVIPTLGSSRASDHHRRDGVDTAALSIPAWSPPVPSAKRRGQRSPTTSERYQEAGEVRPSRIRDDTRGAPSRAYPVTSPRPPFAGQLRAAAPLLLLVGVGFAASALIYTLPTGATTQTTTVGRIEPRGSATVAVAAGGRVRLDVDAYDTGDNRISTLPATADIGWYVMGTPGGGGTPPLITSPDAMSKQLEADAAVTDERAYGDRAPSAPLANVAAHPESTYYRASSAVPAAAPLASAPTTTTEGCGREARSVERRRRPPRRPCGSDDPHRSSSKRHDATYSTG